MAIWATFLKVVQLAWCYTLFDGSKTLAWITGAEGIGYQVLGIVAVIACLVGQDLNRRVYQLLGRVGVYYGSRFPDLYSTEWVTEYPFGYMSDPQYVGSSLTVLAAAPFLPGWVSATWLLNYLYLSRLESQVPATSSTDPEAFNEA